MLGAVVLGAVVPPLLEPEPEPLPMFGHGPWWPPLVVPPLLVVPGVPGVVGVVTLGEVDGLGDGSAAKTVPRHRPPAVRRVPDHRWRS